jgi:hypothetical protein
MVLSLKLLLVRALFDFVILEIKYQKLKSKMTNENAKLSLSLTAKAKKIFYYS